MRRDRFAVDRLAGGQALQLHRHRGLHLGGEVAVGGGHDADVGALQTRAAEQQLALAGVVALTISSGAISFGRGDVQEVVLEQDATAIDSMKMALVRGDSAFSTRATDDNGT